MNTGVEKRFPERGSRPSSAFMDLMIGAPVPVLDKGHIRLIDYMGNEDAIVQAARVSYGLGTATPEKDAGLIRYLMRQMHTSPFEMCEIKLHVKLPIFVARQWIRHRMANVNEISGRYTELPEEFYMPRPEHLARQSTDNKQGRGDILNERESEDVLDAMDRVGKAGFETYQTFMSVFDLAKELARINLPLSTYTEFYWKIDLHNLLHFLRLRMHSHAQYEIRAYADSVWNMVENWVPVTAAAFRDYRLDAKTFSATEMKALNEMIAKSNPYVVKTVMEDLASQITGREFDEFRKNLGFLT